MIFTYSDYRTYLRAIFLEEKHLSRQISLKSHAQKMGISSSFLSEVLNGRKKLSVELAFKMAVRLELSDLETQYFCLLVQIEDEKDPEFKQVLSRRILALNPANKKADLSLEQFKIISEWFHAAILEMTYMRGLRLTPQTIALMLGISEHNANLALERLLRLELLQTKPDGHFEKTMPQTTTESQVSNPALKKFHLGILEKAMETIKATGPEHRVSSTDVVAIDSKYLEKVDRLSREFSDAVIRLSESSKIKDAVYALGVHFFPLTPRSQLMNAGERKTNHKSKQFQIMKENSK